MHALIEGLLSIGLMCLLSMYLFGMTPLDMMLPFGGFAVVYSYIYFVVEDIKKTKQEGKVPTSFSYTASPLPSSSKQSNNAHTDDHTSQ